MVPVYAGEGVHVRFNIFTLQSMLQEKRVLDLLQLGQWSTSS
jgi:hypothetical protein